LLSPRSLLQKDSATLSVVDRFCPSARCEFLNLLQFPTFSFRIYSSFSLCFILIKNKVYNHNLFFQTLSLLKDYECRLYYCLLRYSEISRSVIVLVLSFLLSIFFRSFQVIPGHFRSLPQNSPPAKDFCLLTY
jgi:hypothetical protein